MTADYPDWGQVAAAGLRYLGNQPLGTSRYTITVLDRAIVVVTPPVRTGGQEYTVTVAAVGIPQSYAPSQALGGNQPGVFYVNPDLALQYDVTIAAPAGTVVGFVFADTTLPIVDIVRGGAQLAADSVPVAIATDQLTPIGDTATGQGASPVEPVYFDISTGQYPRLRGRIQSGAMVNLERSTLTVQTTTGANAGTTLTLPAPGAGLRIYVTHISVRRFATAALAGGAGLAIGTTNLGISWNVGNAMAAGGTAIDVDNDYAHPLAAQSSNTAVTLVLPAAGAAVAWNAWVSYYVAGA